MNEKEVPAASNFGRSNCLVESDLNWRGTAEREPGRVAINSRFQNPALKDDVTTVEMREFLPDAIMRTSISLFPAGWRQKQKGSEVRVCILV
jgi:hypothetical protein